MKKLEGMDIDDLVDTFDNKVDQVKDLMDRASESLGNRALDNCGPGNAFGFMISQDTNIRYDGIVIDKAYYALFPFPILFFDPIIMLCSDDDIISTFDYKEYKDSVDNDRLLSEMETLEEKAEIKMISNIRWMEDLVDFLHAGLSVSREESE